MASIERIAYPRLKKHFTGTELDEHYTPSEDEIYWVQNRANGADPQLHLLVMLKTFQRLGYFPRAEGVPEEVVRHLRSCLRFDRNALPLVSGRTLYKHQKAIRSFLNVKTFAQAGRKAMTRAVLLAAQTMDNPADMINVAVEELIKKRFELPAFNTAKTRVQRLHSFVNRPLFRLVWRRFSETEIANLNSLLPNQQTFRTAFNNLKELPKRPTLSHLQSLLQHLEWLISLGDLGAKLADIPKLKIKHFAALARILDAAEIKDYKEKCW